MLMGATTMETDVSSEIKTSLGAFETYDELDVISENKDIPRIDPEEMSNKGSTDSVNGCGRSMQCGSSAGPLYTRRRSSSSTLPRPAGFGSSQLMGQTSTSDPVLPTSSAFKLFESGLSRTKSPRFKLLLEGDLQVCFVNHKRTVLSKILSSKFLRRWESHRIYLGDSCIYFKTPVESLNVPISYHSLQKACTVSRWDANHKFCIRLDVPNGSILLKARNAYIRDQWYHSILWKKKIFKYQNQLTSSTQPELILKELKELVEFSTTTPLHDECISQVPLDIISRLLVEEKEYWSDCAFSEELIYTLIPLLENCSPPQEICRFFSSHCETHPNSPLVTNTLTPIIHRILKHNVDFGKCPSTKKLVQNYIEAIYSHNEREGVIRKFVSIIHGPNCACPHPRVLQNLVAVCLSAVFNIFDVSSIQKERNNYKIKQNLPDNIDCYLDVFRIISEYDDWKSGLAQLLQPVPIPENALANHHFIKKLTSVIERIGTSPRCNIHRTVLGVREGKEGWIDIFSPSSLTCVDDGQLWGNMLDMLLRCCCKRKQFISTLVAKQLDACLLLSLRDNQAAQTVLCLALQWDLIVEPDQKLNVITALQSTQSGNQNYAALCKRQLHLEELHKKGGPRKLVLPSRSTDSDVIRLLSGGALGNLEYLSLAFTHATSACAEHIIKLPALRHLNLWATQFDNAGLMVISEHLPQLQVLNLCETPVTDKGITTLTAMTNLRKLNLNSTKLSAETFEILKCKLPALQELDVRYTEAW